MAPSNSPRALGTLLKDVISSMGIESRLENARVLAAWEDIAGERIGREVERAWMRGRKLHVRIRSSVWRQELHLNRSVWFARLNSELGTQRVEEIIFQ